MVALDGKVAEDEGDAIAVFFEESGHAGLGGGAAGALHVAVFDDDYGGVDVATDVFGDVAVVVVGGDDFLGIIIAVVDGGLF